MEAGAVMKGGEKDRRKEGRRMEEGGHERKGGGWKEGR